MNLLFTLLFAVSSPPQVVVNANLDIKNNVIRGVYTENYRDGSTLPHKLQFWTYPNRFSKSPPFLDDLNRYRIYPVSFDSGNLKIISVFIGKKRVKPKWFSLNWIKRSGFTIKVPKGTKLPVRLTIKFKTKLPKRFGPFGCMDNRCVMGAPWYPLPIRDKKFSSKSFLHTVKFSTGNKPFFMDGYFKGSGIISGKSPFFPVVAGGDYKKKCYKKFCLFHYTPIKSIFSFFTGSRLKEVISTSRKTLLKLKKIKRNKKMWLVEAPLREDLTMVQPGGNLLFSEKIFRILPIKYFLQFHRQDLQKTIIETLLTDHFVFKENDRDINWIPAMVATWIMGSKQSVTGLLKSFDFIPQVDVIIKNPRMEFSSAFLQGSPHHDYFRDDYRRWNNQIPPGSLIFYKLKDIYGEKELERIISSYFNGKTSFKKHITLKTGSSMEWFFKLWLNGSKKVNYRVAKVKLLRKKKKIHFYEIWIERRGDLKVKEPVDIKVWDSKGNIYDLLWFSKGRYQKFKLETNGKIQKIVLDPSGLLVETRKKYHSSHDNFWPSPGWRFIFSGLVAMFNVTEMFSRIYVDADFLPRYDLRRRINLLVFRNDTIEGGFGLSHLYYFGPNINNTRLKYRWDIGFTYGKTRVFEDDISGRDIRGDKYTIFSQLIMNSRQDFILPTKKGMALLYAGTNFFVKDGNYRTPGVNYEVWGEAVRYFKLPLGMSLALYGKSGFKIGDIDDEVNLLRLTGPGFVQGYTVDEFPGRIYGLGASEIRHILVPKLNFTMLGLVNITRITGALYLSAGGIMGEQEGSLSANKRWAASVGYGVRVHGKWFGIYEGIVNFQVAWPLKKYETTKEPLIFFISMEPTF
jgi:hypothetical protein